jgi:hypothetical protein
MAFKRRDLNNYYPEKRRTWDGGTAVHIGGGNYIAKPKFRWDPHLKGFVRKREQSFYETFEPPTVEPTTSAEQPQIPENPGVRKEAVSTYGVTIPISTGRRAVTGNIVDATDLVPRLVGGSTTVVTFTVPVTARTAGGPL